MCIILLWVVQRDFDGAACRLWANPDLCTQIKVCLNIRNVFLHLNFSTFGVVFYIHEALKCPGLYFANLNKSC